MKLIDYKVVSANFTLTPTLTPNKNYKINPKINCSIKRGGNKLICSFNVELKKTEEEIPFEFSLTAVGSFAVDEDDDVSALAVKTAEVVFPFVRASLAGLTQMANVPAYVLPIIDMAQLISKGKTVTLSVPPSSNLS